MDRKNNSAVFNASMIVTASLAPFISDTLKRVYGSIWWQRVVELLDSNLDRDMKNICSEERVNILDFRRCWRIIDQWQNIFSKQLPYRFRDNLKIAYNSYNDTKHKYNQIDMPNSQAFQCLSTMCLLMEDLKNEEATKQIQLLMKGVISPISHEVPRTMNAKEKHIKINSDFTFKVIELVNSIQPGEVVTYGDLSQKLTIKGNKNYSQTISTIIKNNADNIPCHRVVGSNGEIKVSGPYNNTPFTQAQLLEKEGIEVTTHNGREYANMCKRKWVDLD